MSDFRPLGGKAETIRSRQIGDVVIQAGANTLASGEIEVRLEPLVMDLLSMLAEQPNSVVSRDALLETLWHKRHGADESLTRAVSSLRKSFRILNTSSVSIETV
ncbi:MAG: winged helix-turn-helix domain-containing protein, partial [Pseudomonadota bacterium]|nr:winged helix-turn-helix domain-containing protein [Pseudomonadota bacterium]